MQSSHCETIKAPEPDKICAELLKYSLEVIHSRIAEIFNSIARSGEYPEELKEGILVPLPKPGKPQGPPANLRLIILLSVISKICHMYDKENEPEAIQQDPNNTSCIQSR